MADTAVSKRPELALRELGPMRPAGSYTFDELYRFAQMCHTSGMFSDVADAAQAMVKIVKGQEMGLPPTTAMSAFDIIQKKLFIKPWAIAALINASGYGSYRVTEQTDTQCTIGFRRKYAGEGWVDLPLVTYTIAEAQAHGLIQRSPHWKASPAHMLYQRAMGRGGARYFPELLAGIQPPPDEGRLTPDRHRDNVTALFGEPVDPTAYAPPTPAPKLTTHANPLMARIEDLLTRRGLSYDERVDWWERAAVRFPDLEEPTGLAVLYDELVADNAQDATQRGAGATNASQDDPRHATPPERRTGSAEEIDFFSE